MTVTEVWEALGPAPNPKLTPLQERALEIIRTRGSLGSENADGIKLGTVRKLWDLGLVAVEFHTTTTVNLRRRAVATTTWIARSA